MGTAFGETAGPRGTEVGCMKGQVTGSGASAQNKTRTIAYVLNPYILVFPTMLGKVDTAKLRDPRTGSCCCWELTKRSARYK